VEQKDWSGKRHLKFLWIYLFCFSNSFILLLLLFFTKEATDIGKDLSFYEKILFYEIIF